MRWTTLGRTGRRVSVLGLGAGGPSRLGQRQDKTAAESVALIQQALDGGINFIDTAESYGTEPLVGQAIKGRDRDSLVLSTKKTVNLETTPADVRTSLETSLRNLGVDHVDVYHLHAVIAEEYDYMINEIVPVLHDLREQGKLRYIGVTERFIPDPGHAMMARAADDRLWDVLMVGFNLLNQSARERVFAPATAHDPGVLVMFAVRRTLSQPERLAETIQALIADGLVDPADFDDAEDPLGFVIRDGGAVNMVDAAYRFCLYEPGTHVTLFGTGSPEHLRANLESAARPPLPPEVVARLRHIFRRVDTISAH
ncbi:MAG: aldo/keto reductase [Chloroflexi bacterium]|nr:aldo/keto reductase [Chloroflexota bacterium]